MPERHILAGKIASTERHYGPDDPRLADLRRDLAAVQIFDYVQKIVDQAPPLTNEQRNRIAALLRPVRREATAG